MTSIILGISTFIYCIFAEESTIPMEGESEILNYTKNKLKNNLPITDAMDSNSDSNYGSGPSSVD
jgi:hypothetical protein